MLIRLLDSTHNVVALVDYHNVDIGVVRMSEAGFEGVHPNQRDMEFAKKKAYVVKLRSHIYEQSDIDSLMGKTANFTAATAAIMLDIFGKMLTANSNDEFKAAIKPYAPLIEKLQEGIKSGEFKSVSAEQGLSHADAIIECLNAYTKVAEIFEQQETVK